jgi:hypothetical protein
MNRRTLGAAVLGLVLALTAVGVAQADGEAGLVIQHEDGSVESFCIAFTGDGITGEQLLARAGKPVEQVSGLVCAIGTNPEEGCFGAGSFDDCHCQCKSGGTNCRYWAFFTQKYGRSWVYSAVGFRAAKAGDGDLQAWKWGQGGLSSAPVPKAITFEQVCGHAPRGGAAVTATAPATRSPGGGETATVTLTVLPPTATVSGGDGFTPAPASTPTEVVPLVLPGAEDEDEGGVPLAVFVFAGIVVMLGAAIGAAAYWRQRHGA